MLTCPLDLEKLRNEFLSARPFPYIKIDDFLDSEAAQAVVRSYPSFDVALAQGKTFEAVNERKKVQITDAGKFPPPVMRLNDFLASEQFLSDLSYITDIPNILPDPQLVGGGMHITGRGGRLDVHIDFNYMEDRKLHRRLNLLIYLNKEWHPSWGGQFQLWNGDVSRCEVQFDPLFNRCVVFETSEISFHGVVPVSPAARFPRRSFAAYYYTKEAPAHWTGKSHSTVFKARPNEKLKGYLFMPAERAKRATNSRIRQIKRAIRSLTER